MDRHDGFTLLEIMIVVAIIGLLAAMAIPAFSKARMRSQQTACANNLRQIDAAKEQLSLELRLTSGTDVVTGDSNVNAYINGIEGTTNQPVCPSGGRYTYNPIGSVPTCDAQGHVWTSSGS